MLKGLCQNKKHEFDQHTKGGHFCAAHMALKVTGSLEVVVTYFMTLSVTVTYIVGVN